MAIKPLLTNFPQGFSTDLGLRNVPLVLTGGTARPAIWVDSAGAGTGSQAQRRGTFQRPYATVAQALASGTLQANDTIFVKPGHTEAISAAGGWTLNKAGVRIIGLGNGDNRPIITFGTVAGASCLISSAGCEVSNIIGTTATVTTLTQPFDVRAAGTYLAIEWRDVTATTAEATRAILTTAAANNSRFDLVYKGLGGGATCVNAIRLVGNSNVAINIDFYGNASTSVVEFITTVCKNISVVGTMNNAATGNGTTKQVTDTVTGSTFQAIIYNFAVTTKALNLLGAIAA